MRFVVLVSAALLILMLGVCYVSAANFNGSPSELGAGDFGEFSSNSNGHLISIDQIGFSGLGFDDCHPWYAENKCNAHSFATGLGNGPAEKTLI